MADTREIEELRAIPITRILGIPYATRRLAMQCPMPNHNDKSPSFVLYTDNSWHCYGCNMNGQNAVDFAMALGYSFKDALNELKDYL